MRSAAHRFPWRMSSRRLVPVLVLGLGWARAGQAFAMVCNVPSMAYPTIQSAADDASCDDVVLAAGTFTEQVTIGKKFGMTLRGAGPGRSIIRSPAVRMKSTLPTSYHPDYTYIVQVRPGTGLDMLDLSIDGTANSFCGENFFGVRYNNAGGSMTRVTVDNVRSPDKDLGCQNTVAVAITAEMAGTPSVTVDRSAVRNFQKVGILVNGLGAGGVITNSMIHGLGPQAHTAQNGIQVSRQATAYISRNAITDIHYTGDACNGVGSGILDYQAGSVKAVQNTLLNIDRAIALDSNTGDQTITENRVYTSLVGIASTNNAAGKVRLSKNSATGTSVSTAMNAATCFADSGDGIVVDAESGTTVILNALADSGRDAIEVLPAAQNTDVEQNQATRSTRTDLEDQGSGSSISLNSCNSSMPMGLCAFAP